MIILIIVQGLVERSHHSVTARSASSYPDVDQRWTVYGIGILIVSKFQTDLHDIIIIIINLSTQRSCAPLGSLDGLVCGVVRPVNVAR